MPKCSLPLLLLQIEGCFDTAYLRSSKAYYLSHRNAESHDTIIRRLRSIPRKHHSALLPRHFGQDPATNTGVVRGLTMGPTMGLEILMVQQGRTLSRAYNFKRLQIVSGSCGSGGGNGGSNGCKKWKMMLQCTFLFKPRTRSTA